MQGETEELWPFRSRAQFLRVASFISYVHQLLPSAGNALGTGSSVMDPAFRELKVLGKALASAPFTNFLK